MAESGGITEASTVLTPPAVSRTGIKIWHPQWSSTDTSWAGARENVFHLLFQHHYSLSFTAPSLTRSPFFTPLNFSFISVFHFIHPAFFPHSFFSLSKASLFLCSPSCSLNPSSLPLLLPPPTCKSFPVTQLWFSANFSSLLEHISLCGTVALDSCDDFILPLLASVAVNSSGEWGLLRVASAVCYK